MAFNDIYVNSAGSGDGSGSSTSNYMSWANFLVDGSGGGTRYLINGPISRTTNADTLSAAGTTQAPKYIVGFNATPGDLTAQGRTRGGGLVTTNFPVITYTTGGLTIQSYTIVEALSITSAKVGASVTAGTHNLFRQCSIANTHASSASAIGLTSNVTSQVENCDISVASSSSSSIAASGGGNFFACLFTGNTAGAGCLSVTVQTALIRCMLRDAGFGLTVPSGTLGVLIAQAAFRNIANNYINNASVGADIRIFNSAAWGSGGSSKWLNNVTTVKCTNQLNNAVGNMGAADSNAGDWLATGPITLTADPFTSSSDLTLNSTSGGGLLCKATGYPLFDDLGAWQGSAAAPVLMASGF